MKETSESKAEWGPFAGLQRFVGPWLLIRAAGFFAFALEPDCVHSCTVACARISFPGYKKSTFLWYDSEILYRLCAKSHLFTKRLEPMWWRNKSPGSLIQAVLFCILPHLMPPQDIPLFAFMLQFPAVTYKGWLLPELPFRGRRDSDKKRGM